MTAGSSDSCAGPPEGRLCEGRFIRVGISACLLGEEVRYDGGHKRAQHLIDVFGESVEWIPVCPEVEAGFGAPREPVQLVRADGSIRLVTVTTRHDLTTPMDGFIRRGMADLFHKGLSGYILKANSPSCGPGGVHVFDREGVVVESGRGVFAAALIRQFPHLPIEDEGRLADPRLLEAFVTRVRAYGRSASA